MFSYPNSDWYSVYLVDDNGEQYWDTETGNYKKFYFKINVSPDGKDAGINKSTMRYEPPDELLDSDERFEY